jgi:hypothetical protein
MQICKKYLEALEKLENSIDSTMSLDTTTEMVKSISIASMGDYDQITVEPEDSQRFKRELTTTTTTVEEIATDMMLSNDNSNSNNQLLENDSTSISHQNFPYPHSKNPNAQFVSITYPPTSTISSNFNPSQIDYIHHKIIPFCYESNGNLIYRKFTSLTPRGVWNSDRYNLYNKFHTNYYYRKK